MKLTIKTSRLVLRPYDLTDAPRVVLFAGDYAVASMVARVPHRSQYWLRRAGS